MREYGIDYLRETSLKDIILRNIEIAHPDFREELLKQAVSFGLLFKKS